jgi:kynurenine formamidase
MGDMSTPRGVEDRIEAWARELSNWGRWGPDDELGTLNLITDDKRIEAAQCVRDGAVYSLAIEFCSGFPQPVGSSRFNPQHLMTATGTDAAVTGSVAAYADDVLAMSVHAATHWDSLSHVFRHGWMYNERSCTMVTSAGAAANDIVPVARRMVTRGVLLDIPRLRGLTALARDEEITVADLESALDAQRVALSAGDALLIRTGHLGRIQKSGDWSSFADADGVVPCEPGIGGDCLPWLHEHGIAAVGCDNWAVEWLDGSAASPLPVHEVGIVHMGLMLGEIFELDALASACAIDGRYDFLLAAGPLPIRGGVGGPVNPMVLR